MRNLSLIKIIPAVSLFPPLDPISSPNDYEPLAGSQSYTNYLTRLAVYGLDVEILAAMMVDFPVWGANCGKMSNILKKNYGFSVKSCLFLDKFAFPIQQEEAFVNECGKLIDSALSKYEKNMYTAARLLLGYELYFGTQFTNTLLLVKSNISL